MTQNTPKEIKEEIKCTTEDILIKPDKNKIEKIIQKGFDAFHRYGLWLSVACAIGVYVGIMVSKSYYSNKMGESIQIGGFVYEKKVYTISPK